MNHFYILLNFKPKPFPFSLNFIKKKKHYSHTYFGKQKFLDNTFEGIRFQMLHIRKATTLFKGENFSVANDISMILAMKLHKTLDF